MRNPNDETKNADRTLAIPVELLRRTLRERYGIKRRYLQLTRAEEDQRDAEIAAKGRADFLSGKMNTISHDELKKKLGL